jgi:hypothetical protein
MPCVNRKSTPRVVQGRVQKKNRWVRDLKDFRAWEQSEVVVHRERPGEGFRHLVSVRDVQTFVTLIPEFSSWTTGLDAIVLAHGIEGKYGRYRDGVIELRAWPKELSRWCTADFLDASPELFQRLGVEREQDPSDPRWYRLHWTEAQARAFMLMDVFIHELGHHVDRMTSRRKETCGRGEPFAEAFARSYAEALWNRYCDTFGMP